MLHDARGALEELGGPLGRPQHCDERAPQQFRRRAFATRTVPTERRLDGRCPLADGVRSVVSAGAEEVLARRILELELVDDRLGLEPAVDQRRHEVADPRHGRTIKTTRFMLTGREINPPVALASLLRLLRTLLVAVRDPPERHIEHQPTDHAHTLLRGQGGRGGVIYPLTRGSNHALGQSFSGAWRLSKESWSRPGPKFCREYSHPVA